MTEEITYDSLLAELDAAPQYLRREGAWIMSAETLALVKALPQADPKGPISAKPPLLFGKPVRIVASQVGVRFGVDPDRPKRLIGRRFLEALGDAGIIKAGDFVRRVIIDASVDDACVMYVERIGDERLLRVAIGLDGMEIQEAPSKYYDGGGE